LVAFQAQRMVPPFLVDPSLMRLKASIITSQDLIEATKKYFSPVIVLWIKGRFRKYTPEFVQWLKDNDEYMEIPRFGAKKQVFIRIRPSFPFKSSLTDEITLIGYDYRLYGNTLSLILYHKASIPPQEDYIFRLSLLDEEGNVLSRQESPPLEGLLPTSLWLEGEVVRERRELVLPSGCLSGHYWLEIEAVEISTEEVAGRVRLGPIECTS